MDIDDFFKMDDSKAERLKMSKDEWIAKAKILLESVKINYSLAWHQKYAEGEEPDCTVCNGTGITPVNADTDGPRQYIKCEKCNGRGYEENCMELDEGEFGAQVAYDFFEKDGTPFYDLLESETI